MQKLSSFLLFLGITVIGRGGDKGARLLRTDHNLVLVAKEDALFQHHS